MDVRSMICAALAGVCALGIGVQGRGADTGASPSSETPLQMSDVRRPAPDFVGVNTWLNSGPLTMSGLRGKVVFVDFWTHGCINCIRTLPYMTKLHQKYKDRGLVIVGVHTPEFAFEKSTANVQAALKRHGILYPVAQDNDFMTWKAYRNQYWPAQYIVDQSGRIVFEHSGEGSYEEIDRTIQRLLNASS